MQHVDVIIIGAGPIGLNCGIEASKAGLTHLILEKGCLVNSIYHYPLNMTFFSTSERLEIGGVPFISHQHKPNRTEALEYYRRVASSWNLNIRLYEGVESAQKKDDGFEVVTAAGTYHSRALVLSIGFYDEPFWLNIPGEDLPKVHHYYKEAHPFYKQRLVVVGAANSAVDVALETWRKGAEVTMVIRESGIRESVKYWVKPDIENRLAEGSIKVFYQSQLAAIREKEVDISTPDGPVTLANDFVLAMTGYQPPFRFIESLGITFQSDEFHTPNYDDQTMETTIPGLYLAGVVCGGLKTNKWFIENSRIHAEMIMADLSRKKEL
ncbi:MAG: YpdA family putative bacillithiol disulfide reductase [Bacteroidota bacterium]